MQKQQLITLGIVLTLGVLGGIYFIVDPFGDEIETTVSIPEPPVTSPVAVEIKEATKTLGNNSWNKTEFQRLDSKIRTSFTNKLINDFEKTSLEDFLNLTYIQTLNQAAKNFFATARSESGLSSIYSELKRYNGTSYKSDVLEMKSACNGFYGLKKLTDEIRNFDYYYNGGENQVATYFNSLDDFGRQSYLSNGPLVTDMINKSKSSLRSKMASAVIAELRPKIQDYITKQEQNEAITNDFKRQLSDMGQNRFLSNNNSVNSFISAALADLTSHEDVALQMASAKFNPNPCEEICGKHLYYINICKGNKNDSQENISVQDSIPSVAIDTTGN